MRDLVFAAAILGFFAVATLFATACESIVGGTQEDDRRR
jgi:hypothetical protein